MKARWLKTIAALFAFSLVAAACGDSDNTTTPAETETETTEADNEVVEAGEEAEGDVDTEVEVAEETAKYGGTVTYGLEAEAVGLRSWEDACSSPCYNMMISVYDKLVEFRADGTYGPWLAETFVPNDDFTVWTITLREGVTFHNGVELTGQTIADMFVLQQTGAAAAGIIASSALLTVEATGPLTVEYTLGRSHSAFPAFLERMPLGAVFEPAAAAADIDGFSMTPIGTGPFMVDSRDLDNETVMVRNPNYWMSDADENQLPYLDSIIFRPIPDEGTRLDSLLSGTVNAMQTLRQGTIRDARDSSDGLTLNEFQGNNVGGGMFNVAAAPYDDVRVRRGLTQMNNQDAVIDALGGTGISLPGSQWFSPDSPWYSEDVAAAWPQFDFEAGKATLQGYVDDPERSDGKAAGEKIDVELSCPPDPTLIAAMQVLEQLWSTSGLVNVDLTNFDQQTHINKALGAPPDFLGEHGAHCWRWSSDNDPSTELNRQFAPDRVEVAAANGLGELFTPTNFFNYFDLELFGWLNAALQTSDFDERYALYEKTMMRIARDVPIWYSGHTATMIATEDNVVGVNGWILPDGTLGVGFPAAEGRWGQVFIDG
jgi:peptide/nickel transport system substrate-binding protein